MPFARVATVLVTLLLATASACGEARPTSQDAAAAVDPAGASVPATTSSVAGAEPAERAEVSLAPGAAEACLEAARACAKRAVDGDAGGTVDCMPADLVAKLGGWDALSRGARHAYERMEKEGMSVEALHVEPPTQIAGQDGAGGRVGPRRFAIVPKTIVMRTPKGRIQRKSFLLGVSDDRGTSWKFVEGVMLDSTAKVRELLPDFPSSLALPPIGKPEAVPPPGKEPQAQ